MISRLFFYICFLKEDSLYHELLNIMNSLFLQPSPYQVDDFLSGWLRERQDSGKM